MLLRGYKEDNTVRKRNRVRVNGVEYGSVAKAFLALGLPMRRHQTFRRLLKANKVAEFEQYEFELLE